MRRVALASSLALAACVLPPSPAARPAQAPPPQVNPGYASSPPSPQSYPQSYPPQVQPPPRYPQPQSAPSAPWVPQPARPLLAPLVGPAAWQAETRAVLAELINSLPQASAARVRGIPMVFDSNPFEINAFAGCDDGGAPYIAGTEGLLELVDALSQTRATDELFGTQTYEAYAAFITPRLAASDKQSPALPAGIIMPNVYANPQRLSRAHELFDEIVAFTFGHEAGHHYLGHTGCANGQPPGAGPTPQRLANLMTNLIPGLNQPNEVASDGAGCLNTLDAGRARAPQYRWTERGGLLLLDFFSRMERAAGLTPLNPVGFLQSHPNSAFRAPIVTGVASSWHLQHPG